MDNNSIGKIAVANAKLPRSRFNFSSDLHTSMDFGSVVPGRCQLMIPNSKVVASSREKIWCAPMLSPTMGRLGLKVYHNFVRLSDLTKNFGPMLSQEGVSRGNSQFIPQSVPTMPLRDLSFMVLLGASMQFYLNSPSSGSPADSDNSIWSNSVYSGSGGELQSDANLSALGLLTQISYTSLGGSYFSFSPSLFYNGSVSGAGVPRIPLGNPRNWTFYPIDPTCTGASEINKFYDVSDITPDNADIVLPVTLNNGDIYYCCFRLSDFGKRLRKIFIGCGYEINFNSAREVSLLPLLAFYKSYFDVFGLTLYNNWEQSYAYRFLQSSDLLASPAVSTYSSPFWLSPLQADTQPYFFRYFIFYELGSCFFTDEQDFVSSHTRSTAVSPSPQSFINSINTDVDENAPIPGRPNINAGSTGPGEPPDLTGWNSHASISDVIHGQLDSELLKRLYRWTNRNTIAGRRIAEILRAQGLGSYVDECKSDFIGSFEIPISIYDGISQSDTFSEASSEGSSLGERFGSGEADSSRYNDAERPFVFECTEFGYWITLISIVPKGGYAEAIDPTVLAKSKFQFYTPDFDSKGMEFNPKLLVHGSQPFADSVSTSGSLDDSFGLAPRFFSWKFGRNVANGDFTLPSVRSSFASYYLDKVINVGSRFVQDGGSNSTTRRYAVTKQLTPAQLPIAGNVWRYPTRYAFLSHYDRIFNYQGRKRYAYVDFTVSFKNELTFRTDDNFILHMIFNIDYQAPMLPVSDSFETFDDEASANGSMSKA